jgi:hypothetical protein
MIMRLSRPAACAAIGLVLLAGCSKGGGAANTTAPGGVAPAAKAPASGPDVSIQASDMPRARAGYWETATTTNNEPPEFHRFCESGKPISAPGQLGKGCQSFTFKKTFLGAYVIDVACAEGPVSTTVHMTVSGDFTNTYVSDAQASISTQGRPTSTFSTHSVATWIGTCPAGVTPND